MRHPEGEPNPSLAEGPTQSSLFARSLNALKQYRRDAAISFAATILATVTMLANPSPTNHEPQVNTIPATDNNPTTIPWSKDLGNLDPVRLTVSLTILGLLAAVGIEELIREDNK